METRTRAFRKLPLLFCIAIYATGSWATDFTSDGRTFLFAEPADLGHGALARDALPPPTPLAVIPPAARLPHISNFDSLPTPGLWETHSCGGGGNASVSHGILTINSPGDCYEFLLWHPKGDWHQYVDNSRGWIIEAGLRVNPSSDSTVCTNEPTAQIWAHDHTNLVIIGFSKNAVCLYYPDQVSVPVNTTNGFHIYRIGSQEKNVKLYVDGVLRINHVLSWSGGGSDVLYFGDGHGGGGTNDKTQWDYFSYDIVP